MVTGIILLQKILCEICRCREPIPTRVLNPNASEASYKPKQRSYRKTCRGGTFLGGIYRGWNVPGGIFREGVYLEPNDNENLSSSNDRKALQIEIAPENSDLMMEILAICQHL